MSIPAGVIAVWRGTIANIPAGWDLCDGNGGRPNLLGKFVVSVPDAITDPGGEGGSDTHLHVEAGTGGSHNHGGTSGSGGAHTHTTPTTTGAHPYTAHGDENIGTDTTVERGDTDTAGNHNHSWPSGGAHTHSLDTKDHAHTFQNADTRPAYYQVAFIYSDGSPTTFAVGIITLWPDNLVNIPTGWGLDATLVAKFLRSVPAATDPGGTGGADSHLHTQDAGGAHTHALANATHDHTSNSAGSHNHGKMSLMSWINVNSGSTYMRGSHSHPSSTAGDHTHTAASPGTHVHVVDTSDGRPPYHELAPITAGAGGAFQKIGLICIWTGTLANIPAGWELCDGAGSGPNLLNKFIRGVATAGTDRGGTGGNTTHTHTVQAAGNHTHTVDSQGAHIHAAASSNASWSHIHGISNKAGGTGRVADTYYGPSHNHGNLSNTGAHIDHTTTASGTHIDHTYGTGSSLPVYYEVAFIYSLRDETPVEEGGLRMTLSLKGHMGYDMKTREGKARRRMW